MTRKTKDTKPQVSIAGAARSAKAEDKVMRAGLARAQKAARDGKKLKTDDSFVNFAQMLGIGADNALSTAGYGFNPITRQRILLEWMHRGSWLCGVAIDAKAEDMTREGVELKGEITPVDVEKIEEAATTLNIWESLKQFVQWKRLYGGAIAVLMIDGQDYKTPLRLDRIEKGSFKGLLVLDRWQVDPSLGDLITEAGPDIGLPKFYTIIGDSQALPHAKVHHTRVIRGVGIPLPYQQRLQENLWGISVLERLYDRMVAFDSATTGAAQLVYKAWVRTYKIKGLRGIITQGGKAYAGMLRMVSLMRQMQGSEGVTLLDGDDEMEAMQPNVWSGLAEMILQFGQQVSGALQMPLVRLFGQSPAGLNSTGDSDWRMYYDGIKKDQKAELQTGVTKTYRAIAMSEGIRLKEGFKTEFKSLWQITDGEKSEIAERDARTITTLEEGGIISQKRAMEELKQSSRITGRFSTITQEEIDAAEETLPPAGEEAMGAMGGVVLGKEAGEAKEGIDPKTGKMAEGGEPAPKELKGKAKDRALNTTSSLKMLHDLNVAIENVRGSVRQGNGWQVKMPADYGYVSGTNGRDGEEIDCFVGLQHDSEQVFVIAQLDPSTGKPDEDKVMIGYPDIGAALRDYFGSYTDGAGWKRVGGVHGMSMDDFKQWMAKPGSGRDRLLFSPMESEH